MTSFLYKNNLSQTQILNVPSGRRRCMGAITTTMTDSTEAARPERIPQFVELLASYPGHELLWPTNALRTINIASVLVEPDNLAYKSILILS